MLLLASCAINPPRNSNTERQIDRTLQTSIRNNRAIDRTRGYDLPAFLNQELTRGISPNIPAVAKTPEHHFDLAVQNVPAKDFFMGLVKGSNASMMVSPAVAGTISLHLKNVTIPEVMDSVRDIYGYDYKRTHYGYEVFPLRMETKMFTVNYLDISRQGQSYTTISSGEISRKVSTNGGKTTETDTKPSSSINTVSDADFWKNLKETVGAIVGKEQGTSVVLNPQAGIVVVHAYPEALRNVAKYLQDVQNIMGRQVIIEARVLEVELNARFQSGVDWKLLGIEQNARQPVNPDINSLANVFTLSASGGDFSTVINLLNSQGKVNVLSSPRISTLNNQKAVIKIGEDSFFVTNVESEVTSTDLGNNPVISQDIDLTPFFSGIALDVTPQIGDDGAVTLHIHPVISKVTEEDKEFEVNSQQQNLPLAQSDVRESDSIVKARNGQVVVIGGLMESRSNDERAGTPGAEDLPKVGGLFQNNNRFSNKFELIILLRPIVIGHGTWTKQLRQAAYENRGMQGTFKYTPKLDVKKG
jgi:MSHA biogenesis protein MshL